MRRFPAIVLLLVAFSLSLISPLLLAGQQKELPACCRRDGKHHCSKQMDKSAADGVQISALSACPLFPNGKGTPAPTQPGAAPPAFADSNIAIPVYLVHPARTAKSPDDSAKRSWQQRGPPSLVS